MDKSLRRLEMRNLGPLAFGLSADRRFGQAGLAAFHDEGMLERIPRRLDVGGSRTRRVVAHEIADEMADEGNKTEKRYDEGHDIFTK